MRYPGKFHKDVDIFGVLTKNSHCACRILFLQTPEILVYRKATYDDNSLHHTSYQEKVAWVLGSTRHC